MNYFFVFQNKSFDEESKGGYMWAPKRNKNGRTVSHWDKMRKVKKGDIIIHSYKKNIRAISIAKGDCYSSNKPEQLSDEWENDVWMIIIEKAIVNRDKTITFKFTSGTEITL